MKFNIAYPVTGGQKSIAIDDEKKSSYLLWQKNGLRSKRRRSW